MLFVHTLNSLRLTKQEVMIYFFLPRENKLPLVLHFHQKWKELHWPCSGAFAVPPELCCLSSNSDREGGTFTVIFQTGLRAGAVELTSPMASLHFPRRLSRSQILVGRGCSGVGLAYFHNLYRPVLGTVDLQFPGGHKSVSPSAD